MKRIKVLLVNEMHSKNIFDVLGIEEENREKAIHLISQYRELQIKHPHATIWLNDDVNIYINGKVVEKSADLSAVVGVSKYV